MVLKTSNIWLYSLNHYCIILPKFQKYCGKGDRKIIRTIREKNYKTLSSGPLQSHTIEAKVPSIWLPRDWYCHFSVLDIGGPLGALYLPTTLLESGGFWKRGSDRLQFYSQWWVHQYSWHWLNQWAIKQKDMNVRNILVGIGYSLTGVGRRWKKCILRVIRIWYT